MFKGLEVIEKVRLLFWRPSNSMKGESYLFSGYKQTKEVSLVYFDCKVRQDTYGWCIFNL